MYLFLLLQFKKLLENDIVFHDCVFKINYYNSLILRKCIEIKNTDNLFNIPAGNIDEMCFSALMNNVELKNNSNAHVNLLVPNHEKWY